MLHLHIITTISPSTHISITIMAGRSSTKIAAVTGANKGIGFEICKQLATQGNITVVLSARDPKRGLQAVEKLGEFGLGDRIVFHQLDVADSASVAAFAEFVHSKFGKLDILVNNAAVSGGKVDREAMAAAVLVEDKTKVNWDEILRETYETAESCIQVNYYGSKKTTEALLPLLKLSNSPRIVFVASEIGQLKFTPNDWAKRILSDVENLTEEKIDEVLNRYLKDAKEGSAKAKGWPVAYALSKAVVIAYTRLVAKRFPSWKINAVCPGPTKTDLNVNGYLTAEEGADGPVRLALLGDEGPCGLFFLRQGVSEF